MGDIVVGVGLLLFSRGQILTVRELENKPQYHKQVGMLSFPFETFEKEDRNTKGTLVRLLKEELGLSKKEVKIWGICPKIFNPIPKREDIRIYYGAASFLGDPHRTFQPESTNVEIFGWLTPTCLYEADPRRVEVRPILEDFTLRIQADFA
ncbi:MAG: NUDIX hydrolase [Parcubacteria group bacterium]